MDFTLTPEEKMIQQTVRAFVRRELMPLEGEVLRNEREGRPGIARGADARVAGEGAGLGFWGINTPEEYGGANLGPVATCLTSDGVGRAPSCRSASAARRTTSSTPAMMSRSSAICCRPSRASAVVLRADRAGGRIGRRRNIRMSAVKDGDDWVLNGEKIFITNGNEADFTMVFAVTDKEKGAHGGITCFLVDREMGWRSSV